ncbi:MAG: AAA family ATPase [Chloroflexota bacterium]
MTHPLISVDQTTAPQLVIFSGLPGSGKSSIAEFTGRQLNIPVFAKDWLEATLKRCHLEPNGPEGKNRGYASYELLTVLAERQLMLNQSAILDSVASIEPVRSEWRKLAEKYQAQWKVIECICSDEETHRQRLLSRQRGIKGWHELPWSEVERVKGYFAPWEEEHLVLDSMDPFQENCQKAIAYLE